MALLKVNMDNSPCKRAADKIDKFCGTPNIKCHVCNIILSVLFNIIITINPI